mmetsp:Transcript_13184/g.38048  ORF Transcript_13184/g.38048 Transcript_13184/m.38048 type:complete len:85 (+) Transcript_13184:314-568(+)
MEKDLPPVVWPSVGITAAAMGRVEGAAKPMRKHPLRLEAEHRESGSILTGDFDCSVQTDGLRLGAVLERVTRLAGYPVIQAAMM